MAIVNQAGVVVYVTADGVLLCAATCADRENGYRIGQRVLDLRACRMDDACEGCGTPVSTLVARSTPRVRKVARDSVQAKRPVPVPRRTFDDFLLANLRNKQRLIEQMVGRRRLRSASEWPEYLVIEDLEPVPGMSYEDIKAAASGVPGAIPIATPSN